jgi:hypothetical protein
MLKRRELLVRLAALGGGMVMLPRLTGAAPFEAKLNTLMQVPVSPPADWNAVDFNRLRGNAGAVPLSYLEAINAPDSDRKLLGQHLPYLPKLPSGVVPAGFIAVMWGDPAKGREQHPQATAANGKGHWFTWIRIRKAKEGNFKEAESRYGGWPVGKPTDTGSYAVAGGGGITANEGRNTVYLAALPADVIPGDMLRIWGNCTLHGEFVDFVPMA